MASEGSGPEMPAGSRQGGRLDCRGAEPLALTSERHALKDVCKPDKPCLSQVHSRRRSKRDRRIGWSGNLF